MLLISYIKTASHPIANIFIYGNGDGGLHNTRSTCFLIKNGISTNNLTSIIDGYYVITIIEPFS